ncbi:MAG TPA: FimV/HubP family polar landmark protein [Ramlibacter sp.]|uniref:FimV/HubP family polar landmark protein n=1 Tax=Ramlibacter sp. TaxID=1917967 RepID=UPI002D5195FE|nr:FimV/HubP family polar landmark protein [Ramlibacter sp.]HZY20355.1 FimV/HubP family polar landmark protein [Ramlibacter sp.]
MPEISGEEASSLRAVIAAPQAFRAQGMEYNATLSNVQVSLQRRPDGRYFLRLVSDRPIGEPFVDVILETSWASGRITRDFTMLFDPPSMRQGQQTLNADITPAAPAAPTSRTPQARRSTPAPATAQAAPAAPAPRAPAPAAPAAAAPAPATAESQTAAPGGKQVTVQAGDTAGKIAAAAKPATVSLDQMLVALLRSNADAFVGGNVNRLRTGSVLNLPSTEQAEAITPAEARQTLVAQSRDFNEFRRRLAEGLATAPAAAATGREASGRVQAQVDEKKPTATTPDKLTLSKGALQGKAAEEKIARDRAAQEAATRVAELNRNLSDLKGLTSSASAPKGAASAAGATTTAGRTGAAASTGGPSLPTGAPSAVAAQPAPTPAASAATAAAKSASTPGIGMPAATASAPFVPAPSATLPASAPSAAQPAAAASAPAAGDTVTVASASAAEPTPPAAAEAPASAQAPVTPASAPVAAKRPAPPAPAPVPEPSLIDQLTQDPLVPVAAGGILALLLGLGVWKIRQRRKAGAVDSSFLESRLQPDSFFGASGGQRVDTNEGAATGSSMVYSPSQLDAAGDVDPVAEADVYLAYGRDLQAEEILKEALRINPQRVAIHTKLLEIYAKRRDARAFEQVASEAYSLTHGEGAEWSRIAELGQELDPGNALYRPGGQPGAGTPSAPAPAAVAAASFAPDDRPAAEPDVRAGPSSIVDLDLDLDFSAGDDEHPAPAPKAAPAPSARAASPAPAVIQPDDISLDMDFGLPSSTAAAPQPARLDMPDLSLPSNSLDFSHEPLDLSPPASAPAKSAPAAPAAPAVADDGMMEFDLGALSLDLPPTSSTPSPAAASTPAPSIGPDSADAPLSTAGVELGDDDPLATKLALAEEFNAIGDADGARSLAQEVIAEASGDLKHRAQRFLAEIG